MSVAGDVVVVVAAGGFVLVNGINDGGTLIANGLKVPTLPPLTALMVLTLAVATVPLLVGTAVADTLGARLVTTDGPTGQRALVAALLSAIGVVLLLARRGLPTSLTLATIGAIAGSGIGTGSGVAWDVVGLVLVIGLAAPLVGGLLGFGLMRLGARWEARRDQAGRVGTVHRYAFVAQCLAYGANDGQKMLAAAALALGLTSTQAVRHVGVLLAIGLLFALGALLGLRRMAGTMSVGVLAARPIHAVSAELGSASAVFATGLLGAPVSMSQAVTGALAGTGISEGPRRVRWRLGINLAMAWVVTLPAAGASAAALAAILEGVVD